MQQSIASATIADMPTSNAKPSAAATRAAAKAAQAAEARAAATIDCGGDKEDKDYSSSSTTVASEATTGAGDGGGVDTSAKPGYSSKAASHPFAPSVADTSKTDGGDVLEDELVNAISPAKPPKEPGLNYLA